MPFNAKGGEYLAFLGRLSPEKRPDRAIELAKKTGIPLKIAAKVDPKDRAYFAEEIEPLLLIRSLSISAKLGIAKKQISWSSTSSLSFP